MAKRRCASSDALTPDLLLLDIAMPGLDGIGVARALSQTAIAAGDRFHHRLRCVRGQRVRCGGGRLSAQAHRARTSRPGHRARARAACAAGRAASPYLEEIWVPYRAEIIRLDVRDIERIEAERDYMRLHLGPRSYLVHETLAELERKLDPARFIRLHRSAIVRRDRIARLSHDGEGNWEAELACGTRVRVGRSHLASVKAMVGR